MSAQLKHSIALVLSLGVAACDKSDTAESAQAGQDAKPETEAPTGTKIENAKPVPAPSGDPKVVPSDAAGGTPTPGTAAPDDGSAMAKTTGVKVPAKVELDKTRPTLSFADEAVKAKAEELLKVLDAGEFKFKISDDENNALALLHLAHTAEDSGTAAAALNAIAIGYSDRKREGDRLADADYHAVVAYRLATDDLHILAAAFKAAKNSTGVKPPDPKVVAALLDHAHHQSTLAGRMLALDALSQLSPATGPVQIAFLHALEHESPAFVALALRAMRSRDFAERASLEARLVAFVSHADPGVRAQAANALVELDYSKGARARYTKVLLPLLDDPHPVVRGEAAWGLGGMRSRAAAEKLVALLDDNRQARLDLDGWTHMDGSADRQILSATSSGTVASVAMLALSLLSNTTDTPFNYQDDVVTEGSFRDWDYGPAIAKTKAWYAANKAKLAVK